ncbi:MAG TPA: AraC family transcriptional regulator [Pyrinomonadaceae bacterium]|jgi:AraC-like DNA-binding protein
MPVTYEIPVSAAVKFTEAARALGVAPEVLCRAAGLDPARLEDADNEIPFERLLALAECGARLTGDDAFGLHVGERTDAKAYGLLGYVTINRRNFGEALGAMIRYQQIRTKAVEFTLEVSGAAAHLAYHYRAATPAPPARRQESEEMLSTMMRVGRGLTGVDWSPREVHFEHARPADVSEHARIFRAPVHFGAPLTKLVFDTSILELPLVGADPTLGSLLERQAEESLAGAARRGGFAGRVREVIKEGLPGGEARIDAACRRLGVSPRTLQRKLREEGTTFQELLEDVQRALAEFYLRKSEVAICEVSYLTGFSQSSTFHRAFRRWTGRTPGEFRRDNERGTPRS